jgi:FtsH-binding integral membrane protein
MSWLAILGIAVLMVGVASVFGLTPKRGRPAAGTRLMLAARVVLILIGVILLYLGWTG